MCLFHLCTFDKDGRYSKGTYLEVGQDRVGHSRDPGFGFGLHRVYGGYVISYEVFFFGQGGLWI